MEKSVPAPHAASKTRLEIQEAIQSISTQERTRICGRRPAGGPISPSLVVKKSGRHGFAGFQSCMSLWACPVCSAKERTERAVEVDEAVQKWKHAQSGHRSGDVLLLTLTLSHHRGQSLRDLLDAVNGGWKALRTGGWATRFDKGSWSEDLAASESSLPHLMGTIRAIEVKHGTHGWHPHIHALLFFDRMTDKDEREAMERSIYRRYSKHLSDRGFIASELHGVDLRPARSGDYIAKLQDGVDEKRVGLEISSLHTKVSQGGSLLPFDLGVLAAQGSSSYLALWAEYEKEMKGTRALVWSRHFREDISKLVSPPVQQELPLEKPEEDEVLFVAEIPAEALELIRFSDGFRAFLISAEYQNCKSITGVHALMLTRCEKWKKGVRK